MPKVVMTSLGLKQLQYVLFSFRTPCAIINVKVNLCINSGSCGEKISSPLAGYAGHDTLRSSVQRYPSHHRNYLGRLQSHQLWTDPRPCLRLPFAVICKLPEICGIRSIVTSSRYCRLARKLPVSTNPFGWRSPLSRLRSCGYDRCGEMSSNCPHTLAASWSTSEIPWPWPIAGVRGRCRTSYTSSRLASLCCIVVFALSNEIPVGSTLPPRDASPASLPSPWWSRRRGCRRSQR